MPLGNQEEQIARKFTDSIRRDITVNRYKPVLKGGTEHQKGRTSVAAQVANGWRPVLKEAWGKDFVNATVEVGNPHYKIFLRFRSENDIVRISNVVSEVANSETPTSHLVALLKESVVQVFGSMDERYRRVVPVYLQVAGSPTPKDDPAYGPFDLSPRLLLGS